MDKNSIYICANEMPKNCNDCVLTYQDIETDMDCCVLTKLICASETIMEYCPLKKVENVA